MYEPRIILSGAPNARDLGGLETRDGKTLKKNRLIRSGMLANLSDANVKYLEDAGLRTVVDFRTLAERQQKPDRVIEGVDYIICPMLEDKAEGVTRDKPETRDEEAQRTVSMVRRLMKNGRDGAAQMSMLYGVLVTLEHSIDHYRQFFDILLHNESGSLLYHCTMGKDRVGTATALILSALGVPEEAMLADYMITCERCAPGTERLIEDCRKYTDDPQELQFIRDIDTVKESYLLTALGLINTQHGGMDAFLREKMQLDDAKLARLRELYLE